MALAPTMTLFCWEAYCAEKPKPAVAEKTWFLDHEWKWCKRQGKGKLKNSKTWKSICFTSKHTTEKQGVAERLNAEKHYKRTVRTIRHLPHQDICPSCRKAQCWEAPTILRNCQVPFDIFFIPPQCWKAGTCRKAQCWEAPTILRNCQVPFDIFHIKIFIPPLAEKQGGNAERLNAEKHQLY